MKGKKLLALLLALTMVLSVVPVTFAAEEDADYFDVVNGDSQISEETLNVTVDSKDVEVTHYVARYYTENEQGQTAIGTPPGGTGDRDDLKVNIYVPAGATGDSAVFVVLNNGSWAQNGFPEDARNTIVDGGEYSSEGNDKFGLALARDMVVVTYGARSRGQKDLENPDTYVGHSPATVADTKAAIRYVKYNIELGNIPGDEDKLFVTGHSGGGALGSIIASTGNSSDYDEYLVNAAPAEGGDDIFAVLASAPITDLAYADFAYEWTFGDLREDAPYDSLSYDEPDEALYALSDELAAYYPEYVASMFGMTEEEYIQAITKILADSVQHEIDLDASLQYAGASGKNIRPETDDRGFVTVEDGKVTDFDYDAYRTWLINNAGIQGSGYSGNELKGVMAFNSQGMKDGYNRHENNLWGGTDKLEYGVAYPELWDRVLDKAAVGATEDMTWDEYWAEYGDEIAMQMKMVSVMPYLTGSENMWYLEGMDTAGDDSDVAPNWFIRHGTADADTSIAVVASLMLAVKEAAEGEVNAYFGWERAHNNGGDTYNHEFFVWLDEVLGTTPAAPSFTDVPADAYYADAVAWGVENGVVYGTDDTHFSPTNGCTRKEFVTFLWRAAGSQEPTGTENPFSDVSETGYAPYYKAILWGYEQGFVAGKGNGSFEPDTVVTRAEAVTFMHRYAQKAGIATETGAPSFDDVSSEGSTAPYSDAIGWAAANGITYGNSTTKNTFGPMDECERAEMITFLYRLFKDAAV